MEAGAHPSRREWAVRSSAIAGDLAGVTGALAPALAPYLPGEPAGQRLGVPDDAKAVVVAALAVRAAGPVLVVAPTPGRAQALFDELDLYLAGVPLSRLPEPDRLPYEFVRDEHGGGVERARALAALRGESRQVVVASWAALAAHCAGPELAAEGLVLRTGEVTPPGALIAALEERGYAVGHVADHPGSVARHGGVVDVFPAESEHPCRIEFFGDEVESIRRVDLATQRSIERVMLVELPAGAVATRQARAAAAALLASISAEGEGAEAVVEQLEILSGGGRSDYEGFFEPLLSRGTALDHLSTAATVVIEDGGDGRAALEHAAEAADRAQHEQERRGAIPAGLPPLHVPVESLAGRLEGLTRVVHLQRFGAEELGARRLPFRAPPVFAGKLRALAIQAVAWRNAGLPVVIASQQAVRLATIFEEDGISPTLTRAASAVPASGEIVLASVAAAGGFLVDDAVALVTDAEIFGFRKKRRPTRGRNALNTDLVATLERGDYLVHLDHGIAAFGGLVRRTIDGMEREYLELQYAEGDRIFVPADQLDSVTRYVGPSDHPPSLTRLGSGEWSRAKRRVRQAVVEMARDLLDLYARRELARGHAFAEDGPWQIQMEAAFPFVETGDQLEAVREVKRDMEDVRPMDRLICGDVGFGKTEVAIRAAFKCVMEGKQVAVLVPTTVLAEQHGATFRERMAGFPVRVEVLSRFRHEHEQRATVAAIAGGEVDVAIGTHRLLQKDVAFKDLGLVIIDEEQRFGVVHKERLKQMRAEVDVLSLSATPIPRTLQMSLAGIRDMSTVMTPPEERLPIRTYVTGWDDEIVREAIEREIQRGGQVYAVHNRVHDIERVLTRLRRVVPEADCVVGHGQMPDEQLERVMLEFAAGEHDVLVCTTIIESGLDIPNVNTIIINNANQLGLSQLYQLRGRVGRSASRAFAYLLYDKDRALSEVAQKRLAAVFEAQELGSGFQIALRDLEIRGAGNLLGSEQSGHIAAVGFELYQKLVAEAVDALKRAFRPEAPAAPPSLPAGPAIDLPLAAHIPETYVDEFHDRLAVYQRIAVIESVDGVAAMQEELRDRYGPVPPAVEHLLSIALVRSLARRGRVASIKTGPDWFQVHVRGGLTPEQRRRAEALALPGVRPGPAQVRIERVAAGAGWLPLLVRVLRALAVEPSPATPEPALAARPA